MAATADTANRAQLIADELRQARRRVGLTRCEVVMKAGCSLAMLGALEAGAVPQRSDVLDRVRAVLADAEQASS